MKQASNGSWYYEKKIDGKTGVAPRNLWPREAPSPLDIEMALRRQPAQECHSAREQGEMFTHRQLMDEAQASYAMGFNDARPRPMTSGEIMVFIFTLVFLATLFNVMFENWDKIASLCTRL